MRHTPQGYALADNEAFKTSEQTRQAYGLHVEIVPAGANPPPHLHKHKDEAFYVLEGDVTVRCGKDTWCGTSATFVFLPQGIPHAYKVESDIPLKILVITSPGGTSGLSILYRKWEYLRSHALFQRQLNLIYKNFKR